MILIYLLAVLVYTAIEFAFTSGVYWFVCWCFGAVFQLKFAILAYLVVSVLRFIFGRSGS